MASYVKLIIVTLIPLCLFAHGEDKPGPHGGIIRMPGPFHTELKLLPNEIRVWLLDISFEMPVVKDSFVDIEIRSSKGKVHSLKCIPKKDYFSCPHQLPKMQIELVIVNSKRENLKGSPAEYKFP